MPTSTNDDTELQRRIEALRAKPIQTDAVSVEQRACEDGPNGYAWVVTQQEKDQTTGLPYNVVVVRASRRPNARRGSS